MLRILLTILQLNILYVLSQCYIAPTFFPNGFPDIPEIYSLSHPRNLPHPSTPLSQNVGDISMPRSSIRGGLNLSPCNSSLSCKYPRRCKSHLHMECDDPSTGCFRIPPMGMVPCSSSEQCDDLERCVYSLYYTPDPW